MLAISPNNLPQFDPSAHVATCLLENAYGKLLLLQRAPGAPQGGTYCTPGGKAQPGETPAAALCRELREETGLLMDGSAFEHKVTLFVRIVGYDYTLDVFAAQLCAPQPLRLRAAEHTGFVWRKPADLQTLPLITGLAEVVDYLYFGKDAALISLAQG